MARRSRPKRRASLPAFVEVKKREGWGPISDGTVIDGTPCALCGHRFPRKYLRWNLGRLVCKEDYDLV